MTTRMPVVAGKFYPGTVEKLREMVAAMADKNARREDAIGLICPHAGYPYSGPVAGAVISRIRFQNTFIIIGPNHTGLGKLFSVMKEGTWKTPLGDVEIDEELASKLLASSSNLQEDNLAHRYEHSIEVQLPFLQYFKPDIKIVPVLLSPGNAQAYKEIGQAIAKVVREFGPRVIILASTDMTHYEPQEKAREKDSKAIEAILQLSGDELLKRVQGMDITMCGYAPVISLLVAARELGAKEAELVKYMTSGDTTGDKTSVVGYAGIIVKGSLLSPIVKLARDTVETYVREGEAISPPVEFTPEMRDEAGVFVSIHKDGELRGCIGTFEPHQPNVAEEVISNAISSATRDPRFPPVVPSELDDLDYSVDVLTAPEPVESPEQLDPKEYGAIVECGYRRGLLLPDLEGVDTVEKQIYICRQKAGIHPSEPVKLYRFRVRRFK